MEGLQGASETKSSLYLKMAGVLGSEDQLKDHCKMIGTHYNSVVRIPGTANKTTTGNVPKNNLAASFNAGRQSLIFPKADSQEAMLRYAVAQLYKSYLIMAEIMFSDIAGMYIHDSVNGIKEAGFYKQKVKKLANEVLAVTEEMNRKSRSSDTDMVNVFCKVIFTYYAKSYIEDGGTLSESLRLMFHREFMDEIKCIEYCTKNVFDKVKIAESELGSKMSMALLVCNTLKELKGALEDRVRCSIPGYPGFSSLLGKENERLLAVTQNLMREIGLWNVEFPEKEGMQARKMAATFQIKLLKEDMLDKVQAVIRSCQMDYTEYTIAKLKLDMMKGNGKLPFGYYRILLMRLGTHDNVVRLLKEINDLPTPEEGVDIMDYKCDLPEVQQNSVLSHFRRLCVEDKIMVPDAKDKVPVKLRSLRTIAERSGGILPMDELKKLYKQLGTKKAVAAVLKQAGPTMAASVKLLKETKVEQLKAA